MTKISDRLFARFMDGETNPEETINVLRAMKEDSELMGLYISAKRFDAMMAEEEEPALPMSRMAAKAEDNLCDILCERYILKNRFPQYGSQSIMGEAKIEQRFLKEAKLFDEAAWIESNKQFFSSNLEKQWLTSNGVALYNVGRIMEGYGLSVTRHFYSDVNSIIQFLDKGENLIAIINEEILEGEPSDKSAHPNHAVCIISLNNDHITLYNPSTGNDQDEYPLAVFIDAWNTSKNYLVAAGLKGEKTYDDPCPINLDDVELDESLNDLLEALAENNHDAWAMERIKQGWKYGAKRNDDLKQHPDLRPYSELPESEKEYDRIMAVSTLKLAKLLGYRITPPDSEEGYHCPDCGKRIALEYSYCPHCGRQLQLGDFIN